ncbi:MAG: ammonium transporter [Ignavibacteria bacterium]|nr:ammonium transporter [Ignavibacteria bacterium]
MPTWDTGDTGFMLLATSLVMLMTPGLAFFYGGLVGRKNVLAIMIQSFVSMGWTSVLWYLFGFSMCFSGNCVDGTDLLGGIVGNFNWILMRGIDVTTSSAVTTNAGHISIFGNAGIPMIVFAAYQMMFAIITPALITGAFVNRVKFTAYLIFLTLWLTLVYFPFVHMIWGGGILWNWGVKDFAGGIVVHNIAGMAALASVLYVGKRKVVDEGLHSIPLIALGTGLLWFGWYGFNAGSEFSVDSVTANAFLNTDLAASFAAVVWLLLAWWLEKKPKFVGLLTGAVAGLATITPAAGYVTTTSAVIIGCLAGIVCYFAVALKNKLGVDDALDVWGVHGVGGMIGVIFLGVFGTVAVNASGANGLIHGGTSFLMKQIVSVIVSSVYAFGFTWVMLWLINKVTPVTLSKEEESIGLDEILHGERAYSEAM